MKEKKKLDDITKAKLIYSGELLLFSVIFVVLGILKINNIMNVSRKDGALWYTYFFVILTLCGGIWFVVDFIWTLVSKKRRKKSSLVDKIVLLPSSLATFIFDIRAFVVGVETIRQPLESLNNNNLLNFYTSFLFFYFSLVYLFQAFYHYKYPVPLLLEEIEKENQENNQEKEENEDK